MVVVSMNSLCFLGFSTIEINLLLFLLLLFIYFCILYILSLALKCLFLSKPKSSNVINIVLASAVFSFRTNCKGLKIFWGKEEAGLFDRWNPFSSKIPHTIFTSHVLVRRKKLTNRPDMDIDTAIVQIEKAVLDYRSAHGNVSVEIERKVVVFTAGC